MFFFWKWWSLSPRRRPTSLHWASQHYALVLECSAVPRDGLVFSVDVLKQCFFNHGQEPGHTSSLQTVMLMRHAFIERTPCQYISPCLWNFLRKNVSQCLIVSWCHLQKHNATQSRQRSYPKTRYEKSQITIKRFRTVIIGFSNLLLLESRRILW